MNGDKKMSRETGYTTNYLKFISTGVCPGCEDCMDTFGYDDPEVFEQAVMNEDVLDEGSFSWNPCDECNTSLGGDSFYAHGIDENDDLNHFRVCRDCLLEMNGYEVFDENGNYIE